MTDYTINPCKAAETQLNLQSIKGGINQLNDRCYGTCKVFNLQGDEFAKCSGQCNAFARQLRKKCLFGATDCYRTHPVPPVTWHDGDHFFPKLFSKYKNIDKARQLCFNKCSTSSQPNSCRDNCIIDSSAVVINNSKPSPVNRPTPTKPLEKYEKPNRNNTSTFQDYSDSNPTSFYIAFGLISIISILFIYFMLKVIIVKKS